MQAIIVCMGRVGSQLEVGSTREKTRDRSIEVVLSK